MIWKLTLEHCYPICPFIGFCFLVFRCLFFVQMTFQVEQESEVETRYGKVKIKRIVMKDETDECNITLWRSHAVDEMELGSFYRIGHMSASRYDGKLSFSTTYASKRGKLLILFLNLLILFLNLLCIIIE